MAINIFKLNGEFEKIDYVKLETSFKEQFGRTCSEASIYVLNKFPILVSSDTDIDFVLIVTIEDRKGNYIYFTKNDSRVYLHNLIIPVKYVSDYRDEMVSIEGENLLVGDQEINYVKEVNSLTYGLKN